MRKYWFFILLAVFLAAWIPACSGNGNIPTAPRGSINTASSVNSHQFWGLWQFVADPDAQTLDVIRLREGDFHLNALVFLEPPPLVNLTLESVQFNGNLIEADIGLRHPFLGLTEFTGFDVCGIFISNGSVTGFSNPHLRMAGEGDTRLLNPDGYARWWNPSEFPLGKNMFSYTDGLLGTPDAVGNYNSNLNAYKYFCDDLEPNDPMSGITLQRRGMFSAGSKNVRHYSIDISNGLIFNYAVDANWVFPLGSAPWTAPDDFAPEANRPEAYRVEVTELGNTLWNDGADSGGGLSLSLDVYDWYSVELNSISVESPGNFAPVVSAGAIGGGEGFSTYQVDIMDATPAQGSINLLIIVESEVMGYGDILPGEPVTAYFGYEADVAGEQTGGIEVTSPNGGEKWVVGSDHEITWESSGVSGTVYIDYSKDGFVSDIHSIATDEANDGSFLWEDIPNDPSDTVRVKISSTDNPGVNDTSDEDFSIVTDSIWWESNMYNLSNIGWNPTADMPDPSDLEQQWLSPINGFKFTTPVVVDDKIYFSVNSTYWERPDMTFYCYDLASGSQIWNKPINSSSKSTGWRVFSCPVWWQGPDGIERIAVGGDKVYCFNADTGEQLWAFDTTYNSNDIGWWSNQMQVYDGMVLARSRYETLYVLDFQTGALVSTVVCSQISEGGCTAKDDKVYINSGAYIDCADINTGSILWSTAVPVPGDNMHHWVNPVLIDNRIYVTTHGGYVLCLAINNDEGYTPGQIIWSWYDSSISGTAMMAGAGARQVGGVTQLYVPSSASGLTYVYCIEDQGASPSLIWKSSQTGSFEGAAVWANAPSYPDGVVYCPTNNPTGNLYAFDASDGTLVWTYNSGSGVTKAGVSIVDNRLILMSNADVRVLKAP